MLYPDGRHEQGMYVAILQHFRKERDFGDPST
jgi:hypothetical protein